MALGFQPLSWCTIFEKHWNSAESPIIFCAVAWAEEAPVVVAAWAGAAAIKVPQAVAARTTPARAFFGAETVRRKETADTGGLSVGSRVVALRRAGCRGVRRGHASAPRPGEGRRRLATAPRKQMEVRPAKVPLLPKVGGGPIRRPVEPRAVPRVPTVPGRM
ncbi:hypothetical protein SHKM778_74680 [Streptomyces sp. KM77-8]|uniref:Uncharacterized protein n=1 Tax=Streptomyces haneummycinicus TaxID=3074435 RepID=A0AAT9HUM1_9ACTN